MVDSVTINEPPQEPTLEESAAELGILDQQGNEPSEAPERPEWLPEKFSSAEEMAKAYSELESKQAAPTEADGEASDASEEAAREAVEAVGVDFDALSSEFADNGALGEESYETLAKAGIPRDIVDQFIAGQEATATASRDAVLSEAGGQDQYDQMTQWASNTFDEAEIDAFNATISSGNPGAMRMAVAGLKARFEQDSGTEPQRMIGGDAASGVSAYRSISELTSDMNDPRYASDPAFRADVEAKLSRSEIM